MKTLKNLEDLVGASGIEIHFDPTNITLETVEGFGKLTGDWNDHNSQPTLKFQNPAVQGFLSLSLFANYHKRICKIENTDPINVEIIESKFLRPIYVDDMFTPVLTIKSVEYYSKYIKIIWKYELRNLVSKKLVFALIELRYYYTNETTTSLSNT